MAASDSTQPLRLRVDRPIEGAADDVLHRAEAANAFARHVLALDYSHGLVAGVLGTWGVGKTSFINLARPAFTDARARVIDFNPWMFSGADRLVDAFFSEISSELKAVPDLSDAGKALQKYGEVLRDAGWVPFVGPWFRGAGVAMRFAGTITGQKRGIHARRKKIETMLADAKSPIVVVLDDIDRLTTAEIRQVFQLVRLTASFPNIIYLLAFDRMRVEQALSEDGAPGRDYLEKIIQVPFDVPLMSAELLNARVPVALDAALSDVDVGELDADVWPDVYFEIVRPLLASLRDVSRYALGVRETANALRGRVALADVLGLEAVRIFAPDIFMRIPVVIDALTGTREDPSDRDSENKTAIQELLETAGPRAMVLRAVIVRLFPAARRYIDNHHYGYEAKQRWLREKRVAHIDILRLYLERTPNQRLRAHFAAEVAWALLGDQQQLTKYMRSLDSELLEDVIEGLEVFEAQFRPEHVVAGIVVLLNLLPDIPVRPRNMFDIGVAMRVARVVYRLLRSLPDGAAVERAVSEILPRLTLLSSKWEVIADVGHREGIGHRLVSEDSAKRLEENWRQQLRSAAVPQLARDPNLLRLFLAAGTDLPVGEQPPEPPNDPGVTLGLLQSSRSEALRQEVGKRNVRREPRLAWDALEKVVGGAAVLNERVDTLLAIRGEIDPTLRALVEKYRQGWRPEDS